MVDSFRLNRARRLGRTYQYLYPREERIQENRQPIRLVTPLLISSAYFRSTCCLNEPGLIRSLIMSQKTIACKGIRLFFISRDTVTP